MQRVAKVRSAEVRSKEARAAHYSTLSVNAMPAAQSLYGLQQTLPWAHTTDLSGGKSRESRSDRNESWTAYSNLKAALRRRQSAISLAQQDFLAEHFGITDLLGKDTLLLPLVSNSTSPSPL
jgi:hypothetical protein